MSEKCRFCGYEIHPSYNGQCITCDAPYEAGKEEGYKSGYEKGARDMWEGFKTECSSRIGIWINTPEGRIAGCDWVPSKMHETKCCIENCPIAQKLLKAVVK